MSSQLPLQSPAIPIASTILVTGVNGYIASHIAGQLLATGYNVRGTVRSIDKCSWMRPCFKERHPNASFEIIQIKDFTAAASFDEAVKGVAGIIHTTTVIKLDATDPEPHISHKTKSTVSVLEAAAKEPSIKRFVLTSSAWTASWPSPEQSITVTTETWNDTAIEMAYARGTPVCNGFSIFTAAKTIAERAAFDFMKEKTPELVFNAVLPDTVFGPVLSPENQGIPSTAGMIKMLYDGKSAKGHEMVAPQYFVDVVDTAKLHVAALLHPEVRNERLFGHADLWSWDEILAILRKAYPGKSFSKDLNLPMDQAVVNRQRSVELLKEVYGQRDWTSLQDCVMQTIGSFVGKNVTIEGWVAGLANA